MTDDTSTRRPVPLVLLTWLVPLGCGGASIGSTASESTGGDSSASSDSGTTASSTTTSSVDDSSSSGTTGAGPNDNVAMVHVPAGPFGMGCNAAVDDLCAMKEYPAHEVTLAGFSIDSVEVTQARYAACVDAGECTVPDPVSCICIGAAPGDWVCTGEVFTPEETPDLPVVCVSAEMARAYCAWTDKRMPTEAEWEKAARGVDGRKYPWGNDDPDCDRAVMPIIDDPSCDGVVPGALPVGSRPDGASPYGALDMAGNAWEWALDRHHPHYYDVSPASDPVGDGWSSATSWRGGGWLGGFEAPEFMFRTSFRSSSVPSWVGDVIGFRCVSPDAGLPTCGNRIVEPGEVCDDGNALDGDGCSSGCELSGRAVWADWLTGATLASQMDPVTPLAADSGNDAAWLAGSVLAPGGDRDLWLGGTRSFEQLYSPAGGMRPAISGDPTGDDEATGIVVDETGSTVWVVGYVTTPAGDLDILVRAYDVAAVDFDTSPVPTWEWTRDGGMNFDDTAQGVAVDADGTLVIVGSVRTQGTIPDAWVARVDPQAAPADALVWETAWDNPDVGGWDEARGIAVGADGTLAVTGSTETTKHRQIWTAQLDDGGAEVWRAIYDSPASLAGEIGVERGNAVAVDAADGSLVVAGLVREGPCEAESDIVECTDAVVLWYSSDGELVEATQHTGTALASIDEGIGVVAHGDGRIYVAAHEVNAVTLDFEEGAVLAFDAPGAPSWISRPVFDAKPIALLQHDAGRLLLGAASYEGGLRGEVVLLQP